MGQEGAGNRAIEDDDPEIRIHPDLRDDLLHMADRLRTEDVKRRVVAGHAPIGRHSLLDSYLGLLLTWRCFDFRGAIDLLGDPCLAG
ncbi:hypothetical protein ASC90_26390 [Rhizobium sp. Root1220]|nr:hypothetical protein ASC90_26390 [Rhizobium sp. Root1220]